MYAYPQLYFFLIFSLGFSDLTYIGSQLQIKTTKSVLEMVKGGM